MTTGGRRHNVWIVFRINSAILAFADRVGFLFPQPATPSDRAVDEVAKAFYGLGSAGSSHL